MKTAGLAAILILSSFTIAKMVTVKVSDGITVSLPEELIAMTADDVAQRYPSVRAPLGAYTNLDRTVDFSVNTSATSWPDANVEIAKSFFKSSLLNMYDRVDMVSEGVKTLKKKKFIYFEFESRVSGDRRRQGLQDPILKYTFIQYLVEKDRTLVFTFSCSKELMEDWQPAAHEIMQSLRVR